MEKVIYAALGAALFATALALMPELPSTAIYKCDPVATPVACQARYGTACEVIYSHGDYWCEGK